MLPGRQPRLGSDDWMGGQPGPKLGPFGVGPSTITGPVGNRADQP